MKNVHRMNPTERTLQVLEYLMAAGPGPVKQVDIARDCKLPPATLHRIVRSLSEWGYLFRTSEKYCVRNFRLDRNVPMSETYLAELESTIRRITEESNISAEVVVVAGHELLWHSKTEHPDPSVVIRAHVGFRRSLYEIDALSRLYLSRFDWDELISRFYSEGFYETGPQMRRLTASQARAIVDTARDSDFECDPEGNHVGIRRFATVVNDPSGAFLHLLSIAEPATPVPDPEKRIAASYRVLSEARERLMELVSWEHFARREVPQHYSRPGRGG